MSYKLIVIVQGEHIDILHDEDLWFDHHMEKWEFLEHLTYHTEELKTDGIYEYIITEWCRQGAQTGDYGVVEIPAYTEIDEYEVNLLTEIKGYLTDSEKEEKAEEKARKKVKELQDFVEKQDKDGKKYQLCKLWGNSKLSLYVTQGSSFQMNKPLIVFKNDRVSNKNLKRIRKRVYRYFGVDLKAQKPKDQSLSDLFNF